jgi:hypothetical protein
MEFRVEFNPKQFNHKINHQHKLLLIGSCFTENIGTKLKQLKFSLLENPNGILFNPISIATAVESYIANKEYTSADIFYQNECWNSWDHHSRFSHPDKNICLQQINQSQQLAHSYLQTTNFMLITLGSAFVYEIIAKDSLQGVSGHVVANCHKVPTDKFNKKLLGIHEITAALQNMLDKLLAITPTLTIIFTISPVRHLRDGFVENNRSKAALIQAVHQLTEANNQALYFPAYELVIDDLRDYRFYAEDMAHPNYTATNYVWEKFVTTCIDAPSQLLMKEINIINAAKNHRPFNPSSDAHQKFLQSNLERVKKLAQNFPHIRLEAEMVYFDHQN